MAFEQPPYSQIGTLKKTVLFQCLNEIYRACGIEPAGLGKEGRDELLIEPDDPDQWIFHDIHPSFLSKLCLLQASFQGLLHLGAGFSLNGVSGDDDQIIPCGNILFQQPPAFPHEPFGPVALDAVSHFLTGQERRPVIGKPVAAVKKNDVPLPKGSAFPVNPVEIFFFSQYFPLQHFSFNTKRPHQRSLC